MAERQRRDLFGECNVDHHPIDDFIRECCANCLNPECTRSLAGKAKFEQRTSNWFEHYFGDKDRMDPKDPRFMTIAAKKFIVLDPGRVGPAPDVGGAGSAWLDPRDVERQPAPPPAPPPPASAEPPRASIVEAPSPAPAPPPVPKPTPAAAPRGLPHQLLLANAKPQAGQMIPRPPSANIAPAQPKDPWAGPASAPTDEAPVVSPGARVKMGGGGV